MAEPWCPAAALPRPAPPHPNCPRPRPQVYSELIGNIMIDAASAGKYYHFVR